jgi:hypothetical protein
VVFVVDCEKLDERELRFLFAIWSGLSVFLLYSHELSTSAM